MFQDRLKVQRLPLMLQESIEELLYEREHSGIETTPDETSNTIEKLYQYLGKIWIGLFLHAATDPKNKDILPASLFLYVYENIETIVKRRGTTIGNWIRISRYIRSVFSENEISNPLQSLQNFDFGLFEKGDQRSNLLVSFRNEFAHGAFQANAEYIDEHFEILQEVFGELTDLYTRPIVRIHNEKVLDVHNHQCIDISFSIESYDSDPKNVYLLCQEEGFLISLSPFFLFADNKLEENKLGKIKINDLFYAELFASYVQRYTSEMNGLLDSNADFQERDDFEVDQNVLEEIKNACEEDSDKNIFLIEAYPGSHYKALGQELYVNPPNGFDTCIFWDVRDQDITHSATALMNRIHEVCKNTLQCKIAKRKKVKDRLFATLQALQNQNKSVLLYINDLHLGMGSYRQEEYRIVDILQYLVDSPITVVGTLHHGCLQKGIFYDAVFQYHKVIIDNKELQEAVQYYVTTERRKQIFSVLQHEQFIHLFDICDKIEQLFIEKETSEKETSKKEAKTVIFEPQVEYDLWRCSALLSMKREQREKPDGQGTEILRLWSLAHPHIRDYL
jgi:hypothetical protein